MFHRLSIIKLAKESMENKIYIEEHRVLDQLISKWIDEMEQSCQCQFTDVELYKYIINGFATMANLKMLPNSWRSV
ncbi:hypothetical protein LXL04_036086 [Taraxacum kok-saghyz]